MKGYAPPALGRSPGVGKGNSLQYFCLENPKVRGAWWDTVHGVVKSQTWLNDWAHSQYFGKKCKKKKFLLCLKQCLEDSRCSINIYWLNFTVPCLTPGFETTDRIPSMRRRPVTCNNILNKQCHESSKGSIQRNTWACQQLVSTGSVLTWSRGLWEVEGMPGHKWSLPMRPPHGSPLESWVCPPEIFPAPQC